MIYDDIWWYMMIYDDIWWYMMIYDDIWWYMMVIINYCHCWPVPKYPKHLLFLGEGGLYALLSLPPALWCRVLFQKCSVCKALHFSCDKTGVRSCRLGLCGGFQRCQWMPPSFPSWSAQLQRKIRTGQVGFMASLCAISVVWRAMTSSGAFLVARPLNCVKQGINHLNLGITPLDHGINLYNWGINPPMVPFCTTLPLHMGEGAWIMANVPLPLRRDPWIRDGGSMRQWKPHHGA